MNNSRYKLKEIKLGVTYKCNLNCIHCSSNGSSSCYIEMKEEDCLRLIDESYRMGVKKIVFSGGEPLMWEPLESAIERTIRYGIETIIYTSGNAVGINKRLKRFRDMGVNKFIFSLFSASSYVHDKITLNSSSFMNTMNAISASINVGLQPEIHFVPLSSNYKNIASIAMLAKKLGITHISVLRFVPQGRGRDITQQILNTSQNLILKKVINNLKGNCCDIRTGSPYNFLLLNDQPKCKAGVTKLIITPNLQIYPCDAFKQINAEKVVEIPLFSDLKNNSLKECWHKSTYLAAIRNILNTTYEEPCLSCNALNKCFSGCLAQKVIYYGSLSKKPDPLCFYFN